MREPAKRESSGRDPTGREPWRATDADITAVLDARHGDAFAVLGPHPLQDGSRAIRAFAPHAETLEIVARDGGAPLGALVHRRGGFFEGRFEGPAIPYRLRATNSGGEWDYDDAYSFGPTVGETDDYLLVEGTHRRLYEKLGAHFRVHEGAEGTAFAVWAPDARRVSIIGDFNDWDGRRAQMRKRVDSGIWDFFMPGARPGMRYKFEIVGPEGELAPLKADPFGQRSEMRPSTASVIADPAPFKWTDGEWMAKRAEGQWRRKPMSTYEVHLGSWRRAEDGGFYSWDRLADELIPYLVDLGFTHVELLPVSEHPLDASWGYQPIGLFAPTARFGAPEGFARFVDRAHAAGIGVILDWVPAHFPTDSHGLAHFDGRPLYEHADPRRGFHPDWNTAIYDFGRREVANVLHANALYWLDRFHLDGLRVDAVASMLYLDYSRRDGEWLPNARGGRENDDAVAFLRKANELCYADHPGVAMIAEESTAWPGVSQPVDAGGLGFGFKWNMGWMHDALEYVTKEPVHRRWHHDLMTFGLLYAFSENFVLPISHDEVVHGKRSVVSKIPGDEWQRFATARAFYAWMWAHPGKKLLFMGQEFGQTTEWNFAEALPWWLADHPPHRGMQALFRDMNRLYRDVPALHARDCEPEGFSWVVVDDRDQSAFVFLRFDGDGGPPLAAAFNFTPVPREGYRIGLPRAGRWREALNTDAAAYWGTGKGNLGAVEASGGPSHGQPHSAEIVIPPLGAVWLVHGD
ncbi:MAG: 1,4-alpha-glucan branching protein GlgB [Hyphomicrobiales bacterium]|nr:1,4-alpha-glucan branching protein GlgB [Hyphomicrobiales bacterium]MDE2016122.1 1,4-alpha-glucan branching protein GlgB [Hyphomicrobiales bacterium]